MSSFDRREEGFERKFAQDAELRFKARARRNRMVGLWAAEKLGLTGAAAESYAAGIVTIDIDKPDSDHVFARIRKDFDDRRVALSDHQIRRSMEESLAKAVAEIETGN